MSDTKSPEELLAADAAAIAAKALLEKLKVVMADKLPADLTIDKVLQRTAIVAMTLNHSRTTALAAGIQSAITAHNTGLDREAFLGLQAAVFDMVAADATMQAVRAQYNEMLATEQTKKAAAAEGKMFVLPASGQVH